MNPFPIVVPWCCVVLHPVSFRRLVHCWIYRGLMDRDQECMR